MKKIILLSITYLLVTTSFAQAPQFMNYQAVARNNSGQAIATQNIGVRLSVLKNAVLQYSERRVVTTNALGLFNVQIGSSGALATTGTFNTIDWQNNAAPGYVLKVELDINNSGFFTDMGSTAFSSVPYAFAADNAATAADAEKIGGRLVDAVTTPVINSNLTWNGTSWTPVKKDTVIITSSAIPSLPAGGPSAAWAWAGNFTTITVTANDIITGNFTAGLGHATTGYLTINSAVCYQDVNGGAITEFLTGQNPESQVLGNTTSPHTLVTAVGGGKLPAGTYRIGLCIKNKSTTSTPLNNNDYQNGIIWIKRY